MSKQHNISAQEQIEYLATQIMGWYEEHSHVVRDVWNWEKAGGIVCCSRDQRAGMAHYLSERPWNPLTDWNHWRQVEEKVMEDEVLLEIFVSKVHKQCCGLDQRMFLAYIKADLPTRVSALIAAHKEIDSQSKE